MLDPGDCPIGNVRIDDDLRRRRNGNGDAGDRGNVRRLGGLRYVDLWNLADIEHVNNLRDAGNLWHVGNVRLGLQQYYVFFDANLADHVRRRGSNWASLGIHRDQQPWGQLRSSDTYDERTADGWGHSGHSNHTDDCISIHCFICNDKFLSVSNHGASRIGRYRLLNQISP